MNILRIIPSINPSSGGPVEGLINSSRKLIEFGHHVEVVTLDMPDASWVKSFDLTLYALGQSKRTYSYSSKCRNWLHAHVTDYDIVVIHGIWQYHAVAAANACHKHTIPYIIFTRGMLDPWFKETYPLKHLKKIFYWFLILRRILSNADAVVFTTDEERRLARQSFPLYKCNEVVVNYGVQGCTGDPLIQKSAFLEDFPQLSEKPFYLFLSRIHPKKAVDILIEAFHQSASPDHFLVIAGPDEVGWQSELLKLSERLGIQDKIIFTGPLHGDRKWGAYLAADCFILPSHQENFGIVVAEALSASLPVIISDKVNIFQEILSCNAGLVSEDSTPSLSNSMNQWLEFTNDQKNMVRVNARNCFMENFEINNAAHSLEKVLNAVINK